MLLLASLLCGFIFGCGLLVSGMVSPTKVLAFLDVLGDWDPSLAVVTAAAVTVTRIGFEIAQRGRPFLAEKCDWPTRASSMHHSCSVPWCSGSAGDWQA